MNKDIIKKSWTKQESTVHVVKKLTQQKGFYCNNFRMVLNMPTIFSDTHATTLVTMMNVQSWILLQQQQKGGFIKHLFKGQRETDEFHSITETEMTFWNSGDTSSNNFTKTFLCQPWCFYNRVPPALNHCARRKTLVGWFSRTLWQGGLFHVPLIASFKSISWSPIMKASNSTVPWSLKLCLLMSSLLQRNTNFHLGQFLLQKQRELVKWWAGLPLRS